MTEREKFILAIKKLTKEHLVEIIIEQYDSIDALIEKHK